MLIYSLEDDQNIKLILNKALTKQGFLVESFEKGIDLLNALGKKAPSIILLDLMLPDMSGYEVLKKIRANHLYDDIHIIIISAKHMTIDKVEGFDLGADDYIEKPFDLLELMSRIEAHARRLKKKDFIEIDGVTIYLNQPSCKVLNDEINLTYKEYLILKLLMEKSPNCVTRDEIFNLIWDTDKAVESRTIDMHIKSIRSKLKEKGKLIKSIYGVGYKITI